MNPNSDEAELPVIACRPPFQQVTSKGHVVIIRRRMTLTQCEVMRKKARKMVQDVKKYIKRKGL